MGAKSIVASETSAADLESGAAQRQPLGEIGFVYLPTNADRSKRFFWGPHGTGRTHLRVRQAGNIDEQLEWVLTKLLTTRALLC